ncbi:hypothetical protein VP01_1099g5 [Puccinia sorghi]|uniref:Uncharacterized protein n=1 Tax=Puccinia sorghi TaxID=27349 RepID=A0A0L6VUC9_9BASI|nr:hypothetical protein VP01_1099g5 [Puccinia sorghi]
MAKAGITHRDVKGIQTKIQELQSLYGKACDFLRGSGARILDEVIEVGTTTVPAAITKRCCYWDELPPIMSLQTCTNPPVTRESTDCLVRNLLGSSLVDEEDDLPPPFNPPPTSHPTWLWGGETSRLDQVLSDSFDHRNKCFEARELREAKKMAAEDAQEKKKIKIEEERLKLAKLDAEIKRQNAEMEQIRARIEFMERLKNLGHTIQRGQ